MRSEAGTRAGGGLSDAVRTRRLWGHRTAGLLGVFVVAALSLLTVAGAGGMLAGVGAAAISVASAVGAYLFGVGRARAAARRAAGLRRSLRLLRERTRRFEIAARSAQVGVWDLQLRTGELIWDDQMHALYGTDAGRDTPSYGLWREHLHPDDRERADGLLQQAMDDEADFDTTFRIITRVGQTKYVRAKATVFRDAQGVASRVVGTNWDVTDREHAYDALREAQQVAHIGSWLYTVGTGEVEWSEHQFVLLDRHPSAGQPSFEEAIACFAEVDRPRLIEAVERAMETGRIESMVVRTASGENGIRFLRVEGRAIRDADGAVVGLCGTNLDVTHDIERDSSLAKITSAVPGAVFQLVTSSDGDESFPFMSHGIEDLIGLSAGDIMEDASVFFDHLGERDTARLHRALASAARAGHPCRLDLAVACAGRRERVIAINARADDEAGSSTVWHGSITDVTDLYHAQEELTRAKRAAEEANAAKSDFLANMSHEIRTPMTAILGFAELLATDADFAADGLKVDDALKSIRTNASHLLTLINDVLDMSKIEAGRLEVELIDSATGALLNDILTLVKPKASANGLEFSITLDTPIPARIVTDPMRLKQVLLNLTSNAVKFTDEGSVAIRVSYDPDAWQMSFRVVDTGMGMDAAQLAKIRRFDAFSQADTSTTRRFGGTGLGLRISNALSVMLAGGLEVESTPGEGTTVTLTIGTGDVTEQPMLRGGALEPMDPGAPGDEPADADRASPPNTPRLDGRRVLVAEDGEDNQRLVRFHLEKAGAEVTIVSNGALAVDEIARKKAFDVVLMDMQMPEMDGYEAARVLRERGESVPVIALTAHAMAGDRQRCIDAGCDDYLTKPIDRAELIRLCASWAWRSDEEVPWAA